LVDEDLWRYSRISELDLEQYVANETPACDVARVPAEVDAWPEAVALLGHLGERSGLAVVVDGVPVACELSPAAGAAGVVLAVSSAIPGARRFSTG